MRISEAKASLWRFRPLIGWLPPVLFGMLATLIIAVGMVCFPWLPGVALSGTPIVILFFLVVIGSAILLFLVPAQVRGLLRETVGRYAIDANESSLTVSYTYCGLSDSRTFLWQEIVWIGLSSGGLPSCDFIRINPRKGYWFAFGAFFDDNTREAILRNIKAAGNTIHSPTTNAT